MANNRENKFTIKYINKNIVLWKKSFPSLDITKLDAALDGE
jgi:hypothetical protein